METGLGDVYEGPSAVDDGEPSQASNGRDSGIAPGSLADLMDRVDAQLSVDQSFPDVDPNIYGGEGMGGGGPVSSDDVNDGGEEQYGGVESNTEQRRQHIEPPIGSDSRSSAEAMRRLENLHTHASSYAASSTMEGGPENLRHNTNAEESDFYPFRTKEQQLIWIWQHTHQISQKALGGLLDILLLEDEGNGFDVRGLKRVNAAHFNNRTRQYLPSYGFSSEMSRQHKKGRALRWCGDARKTCASLGRLYSWRGNAVNVAGVLGLAEIYTADEIEADKHDGEWDQGVWCTLWDRFLGKGFVVQARAKRRRSEEDSTQKYELTHAPWCKEGTSEGPLFVLRREGFHLNNYNIVFISAPVACYNDAFNCFGMGNKAVQRLRRQTHVGTLPSTGASCQGVFQRLGTISCCSLKTSWKLFAFTAEHAQGEIGLQCEILGLLQSGCLGECMLRDDDGATSKHEVFVRGGLLLWVGDGPGRAKVLGSRACNNFSRFPCPYCMVEQRNITGGDLRDAEYDIEANRRTWGQITARFDTLKSLADNPVEQSQQSMVLGLVTDSTGPSLPMYDSMLTAPTAIVSVERLHFDALGSCQLCQLSCLEMLTQGRRLVSAVVPQNPFLLYPAGMERLKDIVSNYSSLTGSD
ncbi:unnamed protein product [Ectocarpus sp. CCAP 1310/34]|nr:unnamed protein product [Ectocarpus sp. CCAP 1310/34]